MIGMAVLQYGNLRIDPNQRRVYVNEQVVELTTMEFNILYYLALHPAGLLPGSSFTDMQCLTTLHSGLESVTSRIYKIRKN